MNDLETQVYDVLTIAALADDLERVSLAKALRAWVKSCFAIQRQLADHGIFRPNRHSKNMHAVRRPHKRSEVTGSRSLI
jgi:hypothetical protein